MKEKRTISPVKHIAQRTCVACRKIKAKQEMIRLVRTSEDKIIVDITGKESGRGAYLCRAKECWETGIKAGRLEHSLKTKFKPSDKEELTRFAQDNLIETKGKS